MSNELNIFGLRICKISYYKLLDEIKTALLVNNKLTITGANVHTLNLSKKDDEFSRVLERINIIHPDGIGIFFASKILFGKEGFPSRITGSDFYDILIETAKKNNWSFYFFGDTPDTLNRIKLTHPEIIVKGICNGFDYKDEKLINNINNANSDILIVGLGSPTQEKWVVENLKSIRINVIIAVGEGIKVFSGTKKRGSKFIRNFGLEWLVRIIHEPKRLWKRYVLGIPLFFYRLMKYKFLLIRSK